METTITNLRKNIYKLLDQVASTGVPIEIKRKGKTLKIISTGPPGKLDNLKKRKVLNCKPGEIVHIDWSEEWQNQHI